MRWALLVVPAALTLHACEPPPRSASWFEAHPQDGAQVLAACAAGSMRGAECENAQSGWSANERDARMKLYRRVFK